MLLVFVVSVAVALINKMLVLTLLMMLLMLNFLIIGSFSCASAGDGIHADPSECSKFIQCHGGRECKMSCPGGLMFNPKAKICDWPRNVDCP